MAQEKAEIILNVETSQLPHTRFDDPKEIWAQLKKVHRAHGLSTRLGLKRQLFNMKKKPEQPMEAWVASVQDKVHLLTDETHKMDVEDHVIALLQGLPPEYAALEVSLDAIPLEELTVDYVISRMLTFEARQTTTAESEDLVSSALAAVGRSKERDYSRVRCYNCKKRGHIAPDCPSDASSDEESSGRRRSKLKSAHLAQDQVYEGHAF